MCSQNYMAICSGLYAMHLLQGLDSQERKVSFYSSSSIEGYAVLFGVLLPCCSSPQLNQIPIAGPGHLVPVHEAMVLQQRISGRTAAATHLA